MNIEGLSPERYHDFMAVATSAPAPYRFTREEYYRMGGAGLFEGKRVELLDGAIVAMRPQSSPHASAVTRAQHALFRALGSRFVVRGQLPVVLDEWSEPEPDVAICHPDSRDYAAAHPTPSQILLLVEIALSSLAYDRLQKGAAYARAGIAAYVIVNVEERTAERLTAPDATAGAYRRCDVLTETDLLGLPEGATVRVAELLPPR